MVRKRIPRCCCQVTKGIDTIRSGQWFGQTEHIMSLVYFVWHLFTRWRRFAAMDDIRNIHTGLVCSISESDNTLRSLYSLPRRPGPSRKQRNNCKSRNKTVSTEPWYARVCAIPSKRVSRQWNPNLARSMTVLQYFLDFAPTLDNLKSFQWTRNSGIL